VSVRRNDSGAIVLEGDCAVEEAEVLLRLLLENPATPVDWTRCERLHTAVLQVILALAPTLAGPCGDPWIDQWVATKTQ